MNKVKSIGSVVTILKVMMMIIISRRHFIRSLLYSGKYDYCITPSVRHPVYLTSPSPVKSFGITVVLVNSN